jgi:hypothetical protein
MSGDGRNMKVYILKERMNERRGIIVAVYVVNDDNTPPDTLLTKLAVRGYELSLHIPDSPTSKTWESMVRDEVAMNEDGVIGEWIEVDRERVW